MDPSPRGGGSSVPLAPRKRTPDVPRSIRATSHLFSLAVEEILIPSRSSFVCLDVYRNIWRPELWLALCGATSQAPASEHPLAPQLRRRLLLARRPLQPERGRATGPNVRGVCQTTSFDAAQIRRELAEAFQATGGAMVSWTDCKSVVEVYTFAALCWAAERPLDLDVFTSLSHLRDYLVRSHTDASLALMSLHAMLQRPSCAAALLSQAVAREDLLSRPSVWVPSDLRVYDEQTELAWEVQDWWSDREARVIIYRAPPSGGKTASVALLACVLLRLRQGLPDSRPFVLVYACFSARIRDHLEQHLACCGVPHARVQDQGREVWLASSSQYPEGRRVSDLRATAFPVWDELSDHEKPVVLSCDLSSAAVACELCPGAILAYDESSRRADEVKARAVLAAAPHFVLLMSSVLPSEAWVREALASYKLRWPRATVYTIGSRRMRQNCTGRLPDGTIVVPHYFGITADEIALEPHLLRFYSVRALAALLDSAALSPSVHLDASDLASHQAVRNACLRLLRHDLLPRQAPPAVAGSSSSAEDWPLLAWRLALEPLSEGISFIYARDAFGCLRQGAAVWGAAEGARALQCPRDVDENLRLAAQAGVVVLGHRLAQEPDAVYDAWAHDEARRGGPRAVVADDGAIYGVHLPVARVILFDLPRNYEEATHLCGRTARCDTCDDADIFFESLEAARVTMSAPSSRNLSTS